MRFAWARYGALYKLRDDCFARNGLQHYQYWRLPFQGMLFDPPVYAICWDR